MGSKPKINPGLLQRWTDQGKTQTWIAMQFNCSVQAVSKAVKRLGHAKARYAVEDGLRPAVEHKMDAIQQLNNANRVANKLLDLLERWSDGDDVALQVLESQTKAVNVGTRQEPRFMDVVNMKDPRELMVRVLGEIRMQITVALDIQKTMFQIEEVKGVLDSIIRIIQERVPPDVQKLIADELMKKKSLRIGGI